MSLLLPNIPDSGDHGILKEGEASLKRSDFQGVIGSDSKPSSVHSSEPGGLSCLVALKISGQRATLGGKLGVTASIMKDF